MVFASCAHATVGAIVVIAQSIANENTIASSNFALREIPFIRVKAISCSIGPLFDTDYNSFNSSAHHKAAKADSSKEAVKSS